MNSMETPSRVVVPSHLVAEAQFQTWLNENKYDVLPDAAGVQWKLNIHVLEVPDHVDRRRALIRVSLQVAAQLGAVELTKTGSFDPKLDQRMITVLGDRRIDMQLKPLRFETHSWEDARHFVADSILQLRSKLKHSEMHEIKRTLVGRFIDEQALFGAGQIPQENLRVYRKTLDSL
jgi:hypothetical protein